MRHDISDEINKSQLALIYSSRIYTTILMSICAIFVFLLLSDFNRLPLMYWLIFMLGIDAYRIYTAYTYARASKADRADIVAARNNLIIGVVLSGLGWGACTVILYPHLNLLGKFILSIVIIGVATASTTTLSYKKHIAYLYTSLIIAPFVAIILYVGEDEMFLSLMMVTYFIFLVKNISVFFHNSHRLLVLELEAVEQEKEVEEQRNKAMQANAAKSEFLSNMSHELRTPMHAILGFSELGMRKNKSLPKEKLISYYPKIQENGMRLLGLLNDLLDLSKLEAGRMVIKKTQNDMLMSIKSVTEELEPLFIKHEIVVDYKIDSVNTFASYDNDKIIQVILNLLSNAIKFSAPKSCITIFVSDDVVMNDGSNTVSAITVSISDQGEGVPEDELEMIFNKFVQASKVDKPGGTGLGLSICQKIIELHKGVISAFNNAGGGATFRFTIPRD